MVQWPKYSQGNRLAAYIIYLPISCNQILGCVGCSEGTSTSLDKNSGIVDNFTSTSFTMVIDGTTGYAITICC